MWRSTDGRTDDRAVSEVVAFILVFGVILSSVALLSMTGFSAMQDYQENEQLRNSERAMEALADNFNDVLRYDGIERRYGELALRQGTITTGTGGTSVNITVEDNSGDTKTIDLNGTGGSEFNLGVFEYETGSETIAYEGGSVVRASETGNSVLIEQPELKCKGQTAIVSLMVVDADNQSIQSSENQGFSIEETDETDHERYVRQGNLEATVSMNTTYDGAWNESFEQAGWTETASGADLAWSCGNNGNETNVIITLVEAEIDY